MKDILVVGAGIAGATIARLLAENGFRVKVWEEKKFVSGTCYDTLDDNSYIQWYGSHIFRTNDVNIWDFLNSFSKFNIYQHKVLGYVDGQFVPVPFNLDSLYSLFPPKQADILCEKLIKYYGYDSSISVKDLLGSDDFQIRTLGNYIYDKIFKNYTFKQWGTVDVDDSVLASVPVRINKDGRYFNQTYQGVPSEGWTKLIEKMLNHKNIKVCMETSFDYSERADSLFEAVFYSGSLDRLFSYKYGRLPFRSLKFENQYNEDNKLLPSAVVNYPNDYDFTRVSCFNMLLPERKFKSSVWCYEYPSEIGEPLYPIKSLKSDELYGKYLKLAEKNKIIPIGRLGLYKYMDINATLKTSIQICNDFMEGKDGGRKEGL